MHLFAKIRAGVKTAIPRVSGPLKGAVIGAFACMALPLSAPVAAQGIESVDPNAVIGAVIEESPGDQPVYETAQAGVAVAKQAAVGAATGAVTDAVPDVVNNAASSVGNWSVQDTAAKVAPNWADPGNQAISGDQPLADAVSPSGAVDSSQTYGEDDLIGAAEGVFGKGAEGVGKLIRGLLKDQGEPNAYIVGREAGGAFFVGARYGSGTLYHKVEGQQKVYWTGPSIGFDVGANAGNTFVLVYNLFDTEELFSRFPAGEGQAYVVGGMTASYLRKGDKVLIPVRVGAGLRLGVNAGYMKFSKKQRWLPF